jgi:hypothetical protein
MEFENIGFSRAVEGLGGQGASEGTLFSIGHPHSPSPALFLRGTFHNLIDKLLLSTIGRIARLKLLTCAECDLGPLGWCEEGGKEFWLACARVGYKS